MTRKTCLICMRGQTHFDGCSHIDCPNRVAITAQCVGELYSAPARGVENRTITSGGTRRDPQIKEIE